MAAAPQSSTSQSHTDADLDSPSSTARTKVDEATIGDAPSSHDTLGFRPYVEAIARFLCSSRTRAPLTVSLEGPWGSGKSSFMLQLHAALDNRNEANGARRWLIQFNAWRYERDEAIWAAFALNFVRAMRRELPWWRRVAANLTVLWRRLDWEEGSLRIVRTAALVLALVGMAVYGMLHAFGTAPNAAALGYFGTFVAVLIASIVSAWKTIGSPFEHDLKKYFDAPDYRGKRSFVEAFQDDFGRIVRAYVREDERVFVFIDDIDRCDVPRSADVLQSLNLLTSAEDLPIVYIIGLDRNVVAAGIAAKLERQLPYLAPEAIEPTQKAFAGLEIAFDYLEKFIHVPFRIPRPTEASVLTYVSTMGEPFLDRPSPTIDAAKLTAASVVVEQGADSDDIRELVTLVAPLFQNNPRRIKQFLNVFRLQAYVGHETDLFRTRETLAKTLTLPKLAKVMAILLRYPALIEALQRRPWMLGDLQKYALAFTEIEFAGRVYQKREPYSGEDSDLKRLSTKSPLLELMAIRGSEDTHRLDEIDLTPLLATLPAVRPRPTEGPTASRQAGKSTETPGSAGPDMKRSPEPHDGTMPEIAQTTAGPIGPTRAPSTESLEFTEYAVEPEVNRRRGPVKRA